MDTEQSINKSLKEKFGTSISGFQKFRVSWSDYQLEKRLSEYNEFYGSIFVRKVREVKEVPKYPLIRLRWILEKWIPPDPCYTNEVVSAKENGSYECVFIFQDKEGNFLPLNDSAAEIVVKSLLNPNTIGKRTDSSESAMFKEEEDEKERIYNAVLQMYDEILKENKKYPDGTNANKYVDGFKIFVP